MEKKVLITLEGKQDLENELVELKTVKRPQNLAALKAAREQGDLSENAEYDAARNDQVAIDRRIAEIEAILKNFQIIGETGNKTTVHIGGRVRLRCEMDGVEDEYDIVGTTEADPFANKLSDECAVGKAIIGHKKGDRVEVDSPAGTGKIEYTIVDIITKK